MNENLDIVDGFHSPMNGYRLSKLLVAFLIPIVIAFSTSTFASNNGSKIFHESNNSLEISDNIKGNFNIQQINLTAHPIICSNLLTCKQENFIIIPSDKNYNFKSDDLGIRSELHRGKNDIDSIEYYLLQNISSQVENHVLTWNNISLSVPDNSTGNTTNITIWNNISTYSRDGTYRTEYNIIWTKLDNNEKIRGKSGNITIALVFHKRAELNQFAIKTVPSFFGYEEENMTWWNASWNFLYNNPTANSARPYVYSLNISNNTDTFGNTTHLNISCYQVNCTDMRFLIDNTTESPFWRENNESSQTYGVYRFNLTSNATNGFQIYTGATGVQDASNNVTTFIQHHDFASANFLDSPVAVNNIAYEALVKNTAGSSNLIYGVGVNVGDTTGGDQLRAQSYNPDASTYYSSRNDGTVSSASVSSALDNGVNHTYKITFNGTTATYYMDDSQKTTQTTNLPNQNMGLWFNIQGGTGVQYYSFIRQFYYPEPTWATWGSANQQSASSYIPPTPTNLSNRTGNSWINYTWDAGTGNTTNSYNVSQNGTWTNGTLVNFSNASVGTHGWSNISVWAYNTSAGTLSTSSLDNNTRVPNNAPVQQSIGNKTADEGTWLNFSISSTDADNDSLSYATNASKGTLSGNDFTWNIVYSDSGTYVWYFNTSDAYDGVSNETITITVTNIPLTINTSTPASDPTTTQDTSQTFTAGTNRSASFVWMINGTIVQTNNSVNSSIYINSTAGSNSSYNITVNATDGIDTSYRIWNWSVTSQSSTSTSTTYVSGGFSGGGTVYISSPPPTTSQTPSTTQIGIKINLNGYDARIEIPDSDIISALNLYFKNHYRGEYRITTTKYPKYSPALSDAIQYFSVSIIPQPEIKDISSIDILSPTPIDVYQLYTNGWQKAQESYKISSNIYRVQIGSLGVFAIKNKAEPMFVKVNQPIVRHPKLKEIIIQKYMMIENRILTIVNNILKWSQ